MTSAALQASAISAAIGTHEVFSGLSVALPAGRWTSVVGPNGAGKSTLLKALAGLLASRGEVSLMGRPLSQWGAARRAQTLSWLGQGETAADDLQVYDLAMLGRLPHQDWFAAPNDADHFAVERALRLTQSWQWRHRSLGQLSGGERQRVLLARALAVEAQVLLMDEPLANLDPPHQSDWLSVVRDLVAQGKTVVSVLHEVSMALQADEMLVMAQGRIVRQGNCDDAATHRALVDVFDQRISIHAIDGQWAALPRLVPPTIAPKNTAPNTSPKSRPDSPPESPPETLHPTYPRNAP
jgi:iron complex transport system ATP-binding protein